MRRAEMLVGYLSRILQDYSSGIFVAAGFPRRRPEFDPGLGHVGYVMNKVAPEQVFSVYFQFSLPRIISPTVPRSLIIPPSELRNLGTS
jgi:hypothetical protein